MDRSSDDAPANVARVFPACDSSDDEPLMKLKMASASAKTPEKKEDNSSKPNGTNAGKNADESSDNEPLIKIAKVSSKAAKKSFSLPLKKPMEKNKQASDDSLDDKPLIKQKNTSAIAKKSEEKEKKSSRSNSTNNNKADLKTEESSDDEPLIKIARVCSKAAKKSFPESPKKCVDRKTKESPAKDDSSDNEPLSEISKKLQSQHPRKASVKASRDETPVTKSKRNAAKKIVKYAESSSDSSDEEPLATLKKMTTKAFKEKNMSADNKKTKIKDNSSDDDVPLVNLIAKKKTLKKNTKKETMSQKKRQGVSDDSSDDEPLINLVKKNPKGDQTHNKTKASAPKKRNIPPNRPQKMTVSGLSSNSSDDEPLIKSAKHPQVTKILRIILERCDVEDAGPTGSLSKTETGKTQLVEESGDSKEESKSLKEQSEYLGESSEKE
ncbi:hypothetical protein Q5P01_018632 [Channa striata]|uniref:Uncharacterized protein n=1 Tax=Channa striata TaxID=64152 RepID=A0AA88M519_CHASR|nr:hypothetical protein Q5P01_018632 [Channa striata]